MYVCSVRRDGKLLIMSVGFHFIAIHSHYTYIYMYIVWVCVPVRHTSIAMLGRSFVRLRIASLAFQIKTKLNTSFAFSALLLCSASASKLFVVVLFVCCKNKKQLWRAFWSFAFYTSTHSPSAIYDKGTHTHTPTGLFYIICVCLCVRCSACFLSPCNILICKRIVLFLFWTTTTTTIRLALYAPAEHGLARCSLALALTAAHSCALF